MLAWAPHSFTEEARLVELLFILIIFTLLGIVASDFLDALFK